MSILETFGADNIEYEQLNQGSLNKILLPLLTDYLNDLRKNHYGVAYKAEIIGYHRTEEQKSDFF